MADLTTMLPSVCLDDRAYSIALSAHAFELAAFFGKPANRLARVSVAAWMSLRALSDEYIESANRVLLAEHGENAAGEVYDQLREDYPARALTWVPNIHWDGPHPVEISVLDFADQAKWKASHDDIGPYAKRIAQGRMKPVILGRCPGRDKLVIIDGHHRTLAYKHLGIPALAYVADLKTAEDVQRAEELHSMQKGGSSKGSYGSSSVPSIAASIPSSLEPSADQMAKLTEKDPSAQPGIITDGRPALIDAAVGVIFGAPGNNDERKVLCVTRPEPPNEFSIPGGLVEHGESPAQACMREIREEVGVEATDLVWFGAIKSPVDGRAVHMFSVGSWSGTPRAAEAGTKIAWLTPDELLDQAVNYKRSVWEMMAKGLLHSRRTVSGYQDDARDLAITRPGPGRPKTIRFQGLPIAITRPKGTRQTGMGLDGKAWSRTYHTDYGHIATGYGQSTGKLGVYVGTDSTSPHVFWITQKNDAGGFDEFKLFVGYRTAGEASAEYTRHTPAKYFGSIHQGTVQQMLAALGKRTASDSTGAVTMDLGPADVHVPSAGARYRKGKTPTMAEISTKKRNALPGGQFALPDQRKFPIHDAAHVRNAAARLAQVIKAGKISSADAARARAAIKRAAKRFGINTTLGGKRAQRLTIRAQLGPGGNLHVRHHLSDIAGGQVLAFPGLVDMPANDDGTQLVAMADGPVWIQVAKQGKFEGHSAGPFEMNADTFRQIIGNFKATANRQIPIDFEHASEQDPTQGAIPHVGAPAQGWIKDLKVGPDGNLYGLVEWGSLAREYIQQGKYKFFSPAIRFNSRDRVTGKPIGARMTSGALTNQPFLDGMQPMVAKDFGDHGTGPVEQILVACRDGGALMPVYDDVPVIEMAGTDMAGYSALVHSTDEYMPAIRSALNMHPVSMASECADTLEKLYDHLAACGFDHTAKPQGIDLATPCKALRDLVGANLGDDWDKVFDIVRKLIAAAIEQHEVEDHPDDLSDLADIATTPTTPGGIGSPDAPSGGGTGDNDIYNGDTDGFNDAGTDMTATPAGSAVGFPAGTAPQPGTATSGVSSPPGSADGFPAGTAPQPGRTMDEGDTLGPRGGGMGDDDDNADDRTMPEKVVRDASDQTGTDPTAAPVAADDVDGPSGDVDGPSGGVDSMRTNSLGGLTRPSPSTGETYTMSQIDVTAALKDASEKATALAGENATLKGEVTTLKAECDALKVSGAESSLQLKDLAGQVEKLTADNKALSEAAAARAEADLKAKVEGAFATYKDKKNLSDADKEGMLIIARADVAKFDAMYPAVGAGQQHLMRNLTTDRPAGAPVVETTDEVPTVKMSRRQLTKKLMREKGIPFDQAMDMADRIISKARKSGK